MERIDVLGLAAGVLTTLAYMPQALKTWKTNSAGDISLPTLVILMAGVGLWVAYGFVHDAASIWIANGIIMLLAGFILTIKLLRN